MAAAETTVVVFARVPEPGRVKTRLIPYLGAAGAASLQQAMIDRALATACATRVGEVKLWCEPSAEHPLLIELMEKHGVAGTTQSIGDLGARMLDAATIALTTSPRVLIMGTDCPALTASHLRSAAAALETHDAVIIPAEDGGYVLLGLARCDARLFTDICWGSDSVMGVTRERLAALGWQWLEMATLWDVDRPADVTRLHASGLMPELLAASTGSNNGNRPFSRTV